MSAQPRRWESVKGAIERWTREDDGVRMVDVRLEGILPGGDVVRQTVRLEAYRFDEHTQRTLDWAARDFASRGPIL